MSIRRVDHSMSTWVGESLTEEKEEDGFTYPNLPAAWEHVAREVAHITSQGHSHSIFRPHPDVTFVVTVGMGGKIVMAHCFTIN